MSVHDSTASRLLLSEQGRTFFPSEYQFLLVYPGTYGEAASSLGFLQVLRLIESRPSWSVQRTVLDERGQAPRTLETGRPASDFPLWGLSVAYELQLLDVVRLLERAGIPPLACDRDALRQKQRGLWDQKQVPVIVAGGPLTSVNPRPLAALADLVVVGEVEPVLGDLLSLAERNPSLNEWFEAAENLPGCYLAATQGDVPPAVLKADMNDLPAHAGMWSSKAEFKDMYLVEVGRGCSGNCAFCSMRRSLSGGARFVEADTVLDCIPSGPSRVGLVGAEVSRHPGIRTMVRELTARNVQVGLSSLRADAARPDLLELLAAAGMHSPTIAADGASQRLRDLVHKGVTEQHLLSAVEASADLKFRSVKLYQIVGLPGETDQDLEEMVDLCLRMSARLPLHLALSVLVPKPGTPLGNHVPEGASEIRRRLRLIRQGLKGRARISVASPKWTWVQWKLAQGTLATGRDIVEVVRMGGGYQAFRRVLK